ncbi:hypothetical protein BGX29_006054 [Mortierella sp. GBA35]|nr:hypothetical protein BGX29_006054 [Mortierella sp. GBA35]
MSNAGRTEKHEDSLDNNYHRHDSPHHHNGLHLPDANGTYGQQGNEATGAKERASANLSSTSSRASSGSDSSSGDA